MDLCSLARNCQRIQYKNMDRCLYCNKKTDNDPFYPRILSSQWHTMNFVIDFYIGRIRYAPTIIRLHICTGISHTPIMYRFIRIYPITFRLFICKIQGLWRRTDRCCLTPRQLNIEPNFSGQPIRYSI